MLLCIYSFWHSPTSPVNGGQAASVRSTLGNLTASSSLIGGEREGDPGGKVKRLQVVYPTERKTADNIFRQIKEGLSEEGEMEEGENALFSVSTMVRLSNKQIT